MCELDLPVVELVYFEDAEDSPCTLADTSRVNLCPPMITQVCHEARAVARKAGQESWKHVDIARSDWPVDAHWFSQTALSIEYDDGRSPGIFHMNWTYDYEPEYSASFDHYSSIHSLAAFAASAGQASISVERLSDLSHHFQWERYTTVWPDGDEEDADDPYFPPEMTEERKRFIAALQRLPSYLVVVQIVVIHTDFRTGAATGLFGLLGDAPIQIVDMRNEAEVDRYFDFARECESQSAVSIAQDLERRPLALARERLKKLLIWVFGNEDLVPIMHPAIMFRFCTFLCNHPSQKRKGNTCRKRR